MRLLLAAVALSAGACTLTLAMGTEDADMADLLVGCYRYVPGDCTGVFRASRDGQLLRVVAGTRPFWSPDRQSFTFATNSVVWLCTVDGSRYGDDVGARVDSGSHGLCWSADGQYIMFAADNYLKDPSRPGIGRLRAARVGRRVGSRDEPLALPGSLSAWSPAASPDGKYLCFCYCDGLPDKTTLASTLCWAECADLVWSDRLEETTSLRHITFAPNPRHERHGTPYWSPNSKRIAFGVLDTHTGQRQAAWVDVAEGVVHRLWHPAEASLETHQADLRWTGWPLGWLSDEAVLVGFGDVVPRDLWEASLSNGPWKRVASAPIGFWDVAIAPSRAQMAVINAGQFGLPGDTHGVSGNTRVCVVDVETGGTRELFDNADQLGGDLRDRPLVPYCLAW